MLQFTTQSNKTGSFHFLLLWLQSQFHKFLVTLDFYVDIIICDVQRNLKPFVQFKKHKKHPWRSVTSSKVAGFQPATLLKVTLLYGCFSRFLNCAYGTKLCNSSHICFFIFSLLCLYYLIDQAIDYICFYFPVMFILCY